jgi:hypothetical protein
VGGTMIEAESSTDGDNQYKTTVFFTAPALSPKAMAFVTNITVIFL